MVVNSQPDTDTRLTAAETRLSQLSDRCAKMEKLINQTDQPTIRSDIQEALFKHLNDLRARIIQDDKEREQLRKENEKLKYRIEHLMKYADSDEKFAEFEKKRLETKNQ